mmetsp:Transcript_19676/g.27137  ORF Transcript_19676/g.27137 Transcript_19676/m.27137 type:complete len:200 (+) Transcript_19676:540-1139(+)
MGNKLVFTNWSFHRFRGKSKSDFFTSSITEPFGNLISTINRHMTVSPNSDIQSRFLSTHIRDNNWALSFHVESQNHSFFIYLKLGVDLAQGRIRTLGDQWMLSITIYRFCYHHPPPIIQETLSINLPFLDIHCSTRFDWIDGDPRNRHLPRHFLMFFLFFPRRCNCARGRRPRNVIQKSTSCNNSNNSGSYFHQTGAVI